MKVVNIFINDTNDSVASANLINLLYNHTLKQSQTCIQVTGCAQGQFRSLWDMSSPTLNYGVGYQVANLVKRIENGFESNGSRKVTINIVGQGKGAAAALLLCQHLKSFSPEILELNVFALDLVTGNTYPQVAADCLGRTLTSQITDLKQCLPLKHLSLVYFNEVSAQNNFYLFKPTHLPKHCKLAVEVLPGNAQFIGTTVNREYENLYNETRFSNPVDFIAFERAKKFLLSHHTEFKEMMYIWEEPGVPNNPEYFDYIDHSPECLIDLYNKCLQQMAPKNAVTTRTFYDGSTISAEPLPCNGLKTMAEEDNTVFYVNAHHKALCDAQPTLSDYPPEVVLLKYTSHEELAAQAKATQVKKAVAAP